MELSMIYQPARTQSSPAPDGMTVKQARALFISHALTTWNARTYEFAAILFTAEAFPSTLLASSLRGLSTTLAALLLSPAIGSAIDHADNRLRPLLWSISINRASVVIACAGWTVLLSQWQLESSTRHFVFAAAVAVGIVEKLSSIGNMLASERDWVPTLAVEPSRYSLTRLNSVMRRIDLLCKLVSPLVISFIVSVTSTRAGVFVVAAMSTISWIVEIYAANYVWRQNDTLRTRKQMPISVENSASSHTLQWMFGTVKDAIFFQAVNLRSYFRTDVWMPSFALSMLHFSALSYSATMITFLLNSGYSLVLITVARTFGSAVEVSSTFLTPFGIRRLATTSLQSDEDGEEIDGDDDHEHHRVSVHDVGLARSGLWGIVVQLLCLVPVVLSVFSIGDKAEGPSLGRMVSMTLYEMPSSGVMATAMLFVFLSLSRMGLWAFDLTTQELTQTRVEASQRAAFAGTEMAFVSLFELSQWVMAAVLAKPAQFRWIATAGVASVALSTVIYASWVRLQRGHLLHLDRIGADCGWVKTGYQRVRRA